MRDILFTLLMLALAPIALRRPLIGLLTFTWLAYMRPQDLTWGFAKEQRWSFLVAAIMGAGWILARQRRPLVWNGRTIAMVALVLVISISVFFSLDAAHVAGTESVASRLIEFAKIVGVAIFTTALVYKPAHLRILVWVIALSFAFYGVKNGLAGILGGGAHIMQGPGGMMEDNNDFALALCMGLPFLLQIGASERKDVLRRAVYCMVPLTMLTILLTQSRGGFLALSAVTLLLVWRSRNRAAALTVMGIAGVVSLFFLPDAFYERIQTIGDYEADGSAKGRLAAWKTAVNMAVHRPVFGVGLNNFQAAYPEYASGLEHETARATHNAYLQIWAECGSIALLLYLFLIVASFFALWRVRRQAKRLYSSSWILNYTAMFEASLLAFVVGSAFLSRAQFDLFYHLVAIIACFENIASEEMAGVQRPQAVAQRGGSFRLVVPPGFARPREHAGFREAGARPLS
jgi:probable O-glycosylation ligase (exosortase A-associated)